MYTRSAELYDVIYTRMKDYEAESRRVHELIVRRHGSARRLLDVGCGTGEHARHLARLFDYDVDGVDLDENLLRIARKKNPRGRFERADMTGFDLGERYDAVLCLFSAIGYARTADRVAKTFQRFRAHLAPGGLVLVEPWFAPGILDPGRVFVDVAETDDVKVVRMAVTEVNGRTSSTRFEYLIGSRGSITNESETHELGLFTKDEMAACFRGADLDVEFDEKGLSGRGLYIGRAAG